MVLLRDVGQVQEVREGAGERDRRINREPPELGGQGLKVAIGACPRGLGDCAHALDRLEQPRSLVFAQRFAQEFSQEADILSQRFVRIGLHRLCRSA
jgi:hypothetical protein